VRHPFRSTNILLSLTIACFFVPAALAQVAPVDHRVLATSKTSTMEKELNEAAEAGFRFQAVMGGESAFGGKEVVVILERDGRNPVTTRYEYRLLATSKTSTMQKELSEAGAQGFGFVGLTVAPTALGGSEVVAILRRAR
jgi:hypothetical protein